MQRKNNQKKQAVSKKNWGKHVVGIVVSDFNADITSKLLQGATSFLKDMGFKANHVNVVHVPGSFEIPLMCQSLAKTKKYDGLIALGAVIKGATDHYYYISGEVSRGVMTVMLEQSLPIAFGVITTSNLKQAKDRSGAKHNKGQEAAEALLKVLENFS